MGLGWSAFILLAVSLVAAWQAYRLRLGAPGAPGPGLFPFWISLGLAAASVALLVGARRGTHGQVAGVPAAGLRRVLLLTAALGIYGMLLEPVGFVIATFGLLLFLTAGIAEQALPRSAVFAGLSVAGAYLLFDVVLRVQLPRGPLGF